MRFGLTLVKPTSHSEGIKMKAISPLTDFSYDFQDLDFKKLPEGVR
jgi:hypothetical protein